MAINIIFDGPPGPEGGRFVEIEDDNGCSINAGPWSRRHDGLWCLRIDNISTNSSLPDMLDYSWEKSEIESSNAQRRKSALHEYYNNWPIQDDPEFNIWIKELIGVLFQSGMPLNQAVKFFTEFLSDAVAMHKKGMSPSDAAAYQLLGDEYTNY